MMFLAIIIGLQFGYPMTLNGPPLSSIYMLGYAGMIYFGLAMLKQGRLSIAPFAGLGVITAVSATWFTSDQSNPAALATMLAMVGMFQLALLVDMGRFLIHPHTGTEPIQLILLSIALYLLMGGVFAVAANLLELAIPGSYFDSTTSRDPVWQGLMYASFVNLSTLGYGDILPVGPWARSLASLESVTGTLYLAVVVARLVGAYSDESEDSEED